MGLPSSLLERRPDVARAERRMAQANAQIGVAKAAWFPSLSLKASGGFSSSDLSEWLTAPARVWSLGPAFALTLLDFGARRAQVEQAEASYDEQLAAYRQTVLDALKEVEDGVELKCRPSREAEIFASYPRRLWRSLATVIQATSSGASLWMMRAVRSMTSGTSR